MGIKISSLPLINTPEEFSFNFQPSVDKRQIDERRTLAFTARAARRRQNTSGCWARHTGAEIQLGRLLCQSCTTRCGFEKAQDQNRLERHWSVYMLIIGEVGYPHLDRT